MPLPIALIGEFYSNLFIYFASFGGHYLTTWIWGEEFQITKQIVSEALQVPFVQRPTYPYTESPPLDDVMSLLCERSVSWGSEPRLHSRLLTEVNYLLFRIACHNIFHISHVHTIPIDRCIFLYALITDGSICFLFLFVQTIVEVHRNKSRKQHLFFLVFICRFLTS